MAFISSEVMFGFNSFFFFFFSKMHHLKSPSVIIRVCQDVAEHLLLVFFGDRRGAGRTKRCPAAACARHCQHQSTPAPPRSSVRLCGPSLLVVQAVCHSQSQQLLQANFHTLWLKLLAAFLKTLRK